MFTTEHKKKRISPRQAAQLAKSGDWIDYGLGFTMPWTIDKTLTARKGELRDAHKRGIWRRSNKIV